jgi:hypothetical protein
VSSDDPSRTQLVTAIRSAYAELPRLSLHVRQAARLFGVRTLACQVVFDELVAAGQLRKLPDGQYAAP